MRVGHREHGAQCCRPAAPGGPPGGDGTEAGGGGACPSRGLGELCWARWPWAQRAARAWPLSLRWAWEGFRAGLSPAGEAGARLPAGDSLGGEVLMAASFAPFPRSIPYRTLCSRRGWGVRRAPSIHCEPKPGRKASREAPVPEWPPAVATSLPLPAGLSRNFTGLPRPLTQPPTGPRGTGSFLWTDSPPLGGPAHPTRPPTACTRVHGALGDSLGPSACPLRAPTGPEAGVPGSSLGVTT